MDESIFSDPELKHWSAHSSSFSSVPLLLFVYECVSVWGERSARGHGNRNAVASLLAGRVVPPVIFLSLLLRFLRLVERVRTRAQQMTWHYLSVLAPRFLLLSLPSAPTRTYRGKYSKRKRFQSRRISSSWTLKHPCLWRLAMERWRFLKWNWTSYRRHVKNNGGGNGTRYQRKWSSNGTTRAPLRGQTLKNAPANATSVRLFANKLQQDIEDISGSKWIQPNATNFVSTSITFS